MRLDFCVACGERDPASLEHHHLVPRSAGGSDDDANLMTLCHACHGKMHGYRRQNVRVLTTAALAAKKAAGAVLGNRTNLSEASALGAAANAAQAAQFAANVLPIVSTIQASGITTLKGIAEILNARGIRTARGGSWYASTFKNLMGRTGATA